MSFDRPEKNRQFAEKQGFPFRLLCDTDRSMSLAFGACRAASDPVPNRVTYLVGPDGQIEQALETGDPEAQAGELLASLGA